MCTQHQCTQFHQTFSEGSKNIYRLQHKGMGDFHTPLLPADRSSKQKNQ
jgi:hypothetical protein